MRVIWQPRKKCCGFLDPSGPQVTIVSSNLAENAVGKILTAGAVVVVDDKNRFCDLELSLSILKRSLEPIFPFQPIKAKSALETEIGEGSTRLVWHLDESSGYFSLGISSSQPDIWFQLGGNHLYLGVSSGRELASIVFRGLIADPEGQHEAAWIDEIEAISEDSGESASQPGSGSQRT